MKKLSLLMTLIIALSGCTNAPLQPTATPTTQTTATFTATSTTTPTSTATVTPSPTSTPEPPKFCDFDEAMKVVSRLDELTTVSENTDAQYMDDNFEWTEENRELVEKGFNEVLSELERMKTPECLQLSIDYLKSSYIHLRELLLETEGRTPGEAFNLIVLISDEQKLFDEEYARVKECIPTGCQ